MKSLLFLVAKLHVEAVASTATSTSRCARFYESSGLGSTENALWKNRLQITAIHKPAVGKKKIYISKDFQTRMMYDTHDGNVSVPMNYQPANGPLLEDATKESTKVVNKTILDGRGKNLKLNEAGFELVDWKTSLTTEEFYKLADDDLPLRVTYFRDMIALLKAKTGASYVKVVQCNLRDQDVLGISPGYASYVHADFSPSFAKSMFFDALGHWDKDGIEHSVPKECEQGKFSILTAWRNISSIPISNDWLACLDSRSVNPNDHIEEEIWNPNGKGQYIGNHVSMVLPYESSDDHNWYYFPDMRKDEVLLFKHYDSDPSNSQHAFHSSVHDNDIDTGIPRQSIEVRAVAFFPDARPNTCPHVDITDPYRIIGNVISNDSFNVDKVSEFIKDTFSYENVKSYEFGALVYIDNLIRHIPDLGHEDAVINIVKRQRRRTFKSAEGVCDEDLRATIRAVFEKQPELKDYIKNNFERASKQQDTMFRAIVSTFRDFFSS